MKKMNIFIVTRFSSGEDCIRSRVQVFICCVMLSDSATVAILISITTSTFQTPHFSISYPFHLKVQGLIRTMLSIFANFKVPYYACAMTFICVYISLVSTHRCTERVGELSAISQRNRYQKARPHAHNIMTIDSTNLAHRDTITST